MNLVPIVIEQSGKGERSFDIFSRLLRERIIFLTGAINDETASLICAQLLFLESENPKEPINLYINSPGGLVTAGLAKQVEVVKIVAAKIYEATTVGTLSGKNFSELIIATSSPAVAKNSDSNIPFVLLETKEMEVCPKSNVKCANTTAEIAPNICKSEYEINS